MTCRCKLNFDALLGTLQLLFELLHEPRMTRQSILSLAYAVCRDTRFGECFFKRHLVISNCMRSGVLVQEQLASNLGSGTARVSPGLKSRPHTDLLLLSGAGQVVLKVLCFFSQSLNVIVYVE
jgi:hypothetical protein